MRQTLEPDRYEIIVVDDGSTDDTAAVVEQMQSSSPVRLRLERLNPGRGPALARNIAVAMARAPIIAFTDSDCRAGNDWLERGLTGFENDRIAFVTGSVLHKPEQRIGFFSSVNEPVTEAHPSYPTCNAFYRRDVFLAMGGFDEKLCFRTFLNRATECADTDLAWRIRESGLEHRFVRDAVIYHEVFEKSLGSWFIDNFRLFVVPALVKRHPQLREQLLHGRLFFVRENALFYLAVIGAVLGLAVHPAFFALALGYPVYVTVLLRQKLWPWKWPKLLAQIAFLAARQSVVCAGLIYGSIRFRSLVL